MTSAARRRVLVTSRSFGGGGTDFAAELDAAGYEVVRSSPAHDLAELEALLPGVDGWIAGTGPVTAAHLELAPALRVVARYGVGIDKVDVAAAAARGVVVTNTPGANSSAVAEHTVALLLAALRGVPAADRRVRAGDWSGWQARELSALTVGVLGLGRIGRLVIERLGGFRPRVLGADPWVPTDDPIFDEIERASADDLARSCDVVTLHAPGGQTVVDDAWLGASDRPVLLVNTARADLIDEDAVAAALRSGRVWAYAADTLATENHGEGASPLLAPDLADRVIVTPHLAAQTREGVDGMGRMATADLRAVLEGREPRHPVAP
ncbi:hydroxyacid dehydrogenase [Microbacterium sp. AISO3]|uniref:NAD(P)-dependent oxidoreductase n=1 Tax=Microbacterium TaxID=33882 RepID=UPI00038FB9A3|nr:MULTISPECIES: NAD(P)-dependent oxidoreductase [Microbacterium]APF34746.1 hydroxyacid dehydrogenase [Microbacterium paludicola]OWP23583.1 hydroxyacid dehydrogenase [Microbacterium sp. AISO3]GAD34668.1 phosphoglycerate dehydrogenase [Microbacterium sp. TS-1]